MNRMLSIGMFLVAIVFFAIQLVDFLRHKQEAEK